MDFIDLIPNICNGFPFKSGDIVLINYWGEPDDSDILNIFSKELSKKEIIVFNHYMSNSFSKDMILNLINQNIELPKEFLNYLKSFKNVIDIFSYPPSLPKGILENDIPKYSSILSKLFNSLVEDKDYYIQVNIPNELHAKNANMAYKEYYSAITNALTVDYNQLKNSCFKMINSVKGKNKIKIITKDKYILKLDISNRKWFIDDGCGDIPPGEIYIAPIEDNSEGSLFIPLINLNGKLYKNIVFQFEKGKFIKSNNMEINVFFDSLPDNFKVLGEFGIGLNPKVKEIIGLPQVDEKALGTYHIALGMNNFFGGKNLCHFHMDFVFYADNVIFSD